MIHHQLRPPWLQLSRFQTDGPQGLPSWVLRGAPPGGRQEAVIGSNGTLHTDDGQSVALIGANVPFWIYK